MSANALEGGENVGKERAQNLLLARIQFRALKCGRK